MHLVMCLMLLLNSINPTGTLPGLIQKGKASFYAKKFTGRKTAYGERVNPDALEGAHRHLPLNTLVEVTNLRNNHSVIVRINDRGPFAKGRVIDLTLAAAKSLGMISSGIATVSLRVVGKGKRAVALAPPVFEAPVAFQSQLEPAL